MSLSLQASARRRLLMWLAGLLAGLPACGGGGGEASASNAPPATASPPPTPPVNRELVQALADWNETLADVLKIGTPVATAELYLYPIASIAAHDALNGIGARYARYLDGDALRADANPVAAVVKAVRDVIVATLPAAQSMVDGRYAAALATIPAGMARDAGIEVGATAAARVLADRGSDLASGHPPFAMTTRSQFRVPPPYGVASTEPNIHLAATRTAAFATDFNEVRCIGREQTVMIAGCADRSAEQTDIALFWAESCTRGWNRAARNVAAARSDFDGWQLARLLALIHIAVTDSQNAASDSKSAYDFWRPEAAMAGADSDGNPDTRPEPGWAPVRPTPSSPDYPSAHATGGDAGMAVLIAEFGDNVPFSMTSTSRIGVTRSFASFSQAAAENAVSRVYIGFHFRHATEVGRGLGRKVGDWAVANKLRPL